MLTRAQILWATAFVLCMDRPLPNDIPVVYETEEEDEDEPDSGGDP